MKIAVNTRLLLPGKLEGIGWFTCETLSRITKAHPEHEFIFLFDRAFDERFIFSDNVTPVVLYPQARHPFLYYLWFDWVIPPVLRKRKADLFLSPDGYLSLNSEKKQLAVIHDINFEYYPRHLPPVTRKYYRYFFPKFAEKATRIATVSEFSKQDLIRLYDVHPDKIDVVYNGVSNAFHPLPEDEKIATRKKYTNGHPYFIFVGAIHPRKNLQQLFRAFDKFKNETDNDVKLMVVGDKMWWTSKIRKAFDRMKNKDDVVFTGRLEQDELTKAMGAAEALLYVSFFEGFGIPILEAMKSEVPVITSNITAMPEVAGKAALFVSPFDSDSIKEQMKAVYYDKELRKKLIALGIERVKHFSWDKTAELLWQSIAKTLNEA